MRKRKLILSVTKKDFDITFFSGSGAGGQHRNKKKCCVRMKHRDSGAMSTGQDSRDKQTNIRNAFLRLIETDCFKNWERIQIARKMVNESEIEKAVDEWISKNDINIIDVKLHTSENKVIVAIIYEELTSL